MSAPKNGQGATTGAQYAPYLPFERKKVSSSEITAPSRRVSGGCADLPKAEKARQNAIYEEGAPMRARQARMQQELERNKNERIAELEKAAAELRKALKVGDETNCGPVIEIKSGLVKVYRPVLNYGNEHWLRLEQILPAGQGCIFENGQYVGS